MLPWDTPGTSNSVGELTSSRATERGHEEYMFNKYTVEYNTALADALILETKQRLISRNCYVIASKYA